MDVADRLKSVLDAASGAGYKVRHVTVSEDIVTMDLESTAVPDFEPEEVSQDELAKRARQDARLRALSLDPAGL